MNKDDKIKDDKWEFDDYAFTLTGAIVGILIVAPELLYSLLGINIFGGSLSNMPSDFLGGVADGYGLISLNIYELRSLSPMLFLLTITVCMFKDAFDVRESGKYSGSVFEHTFESLLEDAIYMGTTMIMVYGAVFFGAMYASWLAGPITWILFVFILPLAKKRNDGEVNEDNTPWLLLLIFLAGIIVEGITGTWTAFPASWLIISAIKSVKIIVGGINTTNDIFDLLYNSFAFICQE